MNDLFEIIKAQPIDGFVPFVSICILSTIFFTMDRHPQPTTVFGVAGVSSIFVGSGELRAVISGDIGELPFKRFGVELRDNRYSETVRGL